MKLRIFPTIFILFLALGFGFISNISAQENADQAQPTTQENADQAQPKTQNAEIMGEDDRLPFMQNEQSATSAEPSSGSLLLKTLGSMCLIIGLLFFGAWGVKKYGLFGAKATITEDAPNLRIMSSVTVAGGQTISVIRFGERVLLVGSTAQSITLLADEYGEESAEPEKKPKSVSDLLAEENASFGRELNTAQSRLNSGYENGGGRI